jgi:HlyD family secretion protein
VGVVVVAAVSIVLAGILATSGNGGPSYRTASVERADVDATLDSLGTIQPINQANLSFPIGGNMESVSATVGQHVTVGQNLAQLNTTSLDAQVAAAESTVAAAQARLTADESSQTSGAVTAAVAPTTFSTVITSGDDTHAAKTGSSDPTAAARELVTDQQAILIADQHRADQNLAQEKRDLTTEASLCQPFRTSADTVATPQNSPSPPGRRSMSSLTATTTAPRAPKSRPAAPAPQEAATTPATPDASPCRSMIATVLAEQVAVDHDQQTVATDLPTLSAALDKFMAATQAGDRSQPPQSPQPQQSPEPPQSPQSPQSPQPQQSPRPQPGAKAASAAVSAGQSARAASSAGSTTHSPSAPRPASAEQLASDQAAIDAAKAQLAEAQQAHDQAKLRSPIDGTVGSVTISAGQSVQGSSSAPQIVIIGPGAHQVTTSVSDISVGSVRVGDDATVVPSGSSTPLHGQVSSIGLLASSGSSPSAGSISYPVTIGLASTDEQLFTGQSASVSIMLAHASGTLTVPSSAVHHADASDIVSVLRNGTPRNILVTLGAAGPTRTQVLTGLNAGEQVILADLSQPLPTGDTQNLRRVTGGGSGRPGG